MNKDKKVLDVNQLILLIKENVKDGVISHGGRQFFGYVKINFEHGKEVIVEQYETIK